MNVTVRLNRYFLLDPCVASDILDWKILLSTEGPVRGGHYASLSVGLPVTRTLPQFKLSRLLGALPTSSSARRRLNRPGAKDSESSHG